MSSSVLRQNTLQAITKLVEAAASEPQGAATDERGSLFDTLREFPNRYWHLYRSCMATIVSDPALTNRSHYEIQGDVWSLLNEVIRDKDRFRSRQERRDIVRRFAGQLARDTNVYEVIVRIDGITLPDGEISVGPTTFVHFDAERAGVWGLSTRPLNLGDKLIDRTVAIIRVSAGSFDRAWELATPEIDTSLDIMRAAMTGSRAAPQMNELFLQRRSTYFAIKQIAGSQEIQSGFRADFGMVELDIRGILKERAEALMQAVQNFATEVSWLYDGAISMSLARPLLRALEWIGSSITRERYDDKIVDLCTAMECMLAVESDRLKGQAIALRYILLSATRGGNYIMPHLVMPVYELRSHVIHGADRNVASVVQCDGLREVAMTTFSLVSDLIIKHDEIRSIRNLVDFLESDDEAIQKAIMMILDGNRFKSDRAVEKYAESILDRLHEAKLLGQVSDEAYRKSLGDLLQACRRLSLQLSRRESGISINLPIGDAIEPLGIGWLYPPGVSGADQMRDLTLGCVQTSGVSKPSLELAIDDYTRKLADLPGAEPFYVESLAVYHLDPAAIIQRRTQIIEAFAELVQRAREDS